MDCEHGQEQLALLLDGEAAAAGQGELFAHLGVCDACRRWFDVVMSTRAAAARDRDAVAHEADAIPLPLPLPSAAPAGRARPRRLPAWRLPVPLAATLAVLLVAGGALLGAQWPGLAGSARQVAAQAGRAPVVVICSLPEVTVR